MGALEVELYLTHLAVGEKVSTNTQKQALNALVFLYHRVLQKPLGRFRDIERPKRPQRRPLVLGKDEVERILQVMSGTHQLIATLLFGTGMRLLECLRLRAKDVDFALNQIVVRDGKGWKDRVTMLPQRIKPDLEKHLARVREIHRRDVASGGRRLFTGRLGTQISQCQSPMGVAVCFSIPDAFEGSAHGRKASTSSAREFYPESAQQSGSASRNRQACDMSYSPAFIRHGAFGCRVRYPHRARTPWS